MDVRQKLGSGLQASGSQAFGIEDTAMDMVRIRVGRAGIAAIALGVGLASAGSSAFAQAATCDWYANTALQQQKVNVERKCGFKGDSWSFDRGSHILWCQSVAPDQWKRQAQFREQELVKCQSGRR